MLDVEVGSPAARDRQGAERSHILSLIARAGRSGAAAAVEGYSLGMTRADVERQAEAGLVATQGSSGRDREPSVDCTATTSLGRHVLAAIPAGYRIMPPGGGELRVTFIDDAGEARVSEIDWSPAKPSSLQDWLALLSRRYGKPTFTSSERGETRWRWCLPDETECDSEQETALPSLTATYRDSEEASLELSAGNEIGSAAPEVARRSLGSVGCRRAMTGEEERIVESYIVARSDTVGAGGRTVLRTSLLPQALQAALRRRLGEPVFFRALGPASWLARYDVGYDRDPASYSETKYVIFSPSPSGYEAVWQGDAKAARGRLVSPESIR